MDDYDYNEPEYDDEDAYRLYAEWAVEHGLFDDSDLHLGNIHIELATDDPRAAQATRGTRVSPTQLLNLLASNGLQRIFQHSGFAGSTFAVYDDEEDYEEDDDEEDDEDQDYNPRYTRRRRRRPVENHYPKVPSEAGTQLMRSGGFGTNDHFVDELKKRRQRLETKLMWRELGIGSIGARRRAAQAVFQNLIPGTVADKIIHYDSRCYSGQFSDDGNFFFSCAQDFKVRMYDTSNPFEWTHYKAVDYPFGEWTITDASLSPDNRFLAYSSIQKEVCLAPTDPADTSDPTILDLSTRRSDFGIWSVRFSGDGREIVAGTSKIRSVIVYDIEARQPVLRLANHDHDVNAVCFGDVSSPHIIYSGSDDTTIRVWDRRSMADGREAGAFIGHTEGITYVDSKGDGRYVLSNGKDQTMKLWDLRKMMTTAKFDTIDIYQYSTGFDYRFEPYIGYELNPNDCSVVTFRGHRVLKTLIRCHFSPPGSTNSRYVYTGSEDGKVYVYNLDATLAGTIDVAKATVNSRPRDPELFTGYSMSFGGGDMVWRTCVRDTSWHPNAPVLAATAWNGWGLSTGTCTLHTWNDSANGDEGDPPVGRSYDCKLRYLPLYHQRSNRRGGLRSRPVTRQEPQGDESPELPALEEVDPPRWTMW